MEFSVILTLVIIALLITALIFGSKAYYHNVLTPKKRLSALESSLAKAAAYNVSIENGKQKGEKISVLEILDYESRINNKASFVAKRTQGMFHPGPYDYELTDEEWNFVHQRYPELVENISGHNLKIESYQRLLREQELRMQKLISSSREEMKNISSLDSSQQWIDEFSALDKDNEEKTAYRDNFSWTKEREEMMDKRVQAYLDDQQKRLKKEAEQRRKKRTR